MTVTSSLSSASPYATASTTTALTVLASVAASTVQETNTKILATVNRDIQNQLNAKLAALQQSPDTAVLNGLQAQIAALHTQQTAISHLTASSVTNAGILSDLQNQLATLQTDAAAGNSAGFDATLSAANTDLSDLTPITPPAPFQADRVSSLLGTGLGVGNSASYDLSTPAGQAAAAAAVSNAQTAVGQVFSLITANELLANSIITALTTQVNNLTRQQQQLDAADRAQINSATSRLTQQATDREHLIELNLGSASTIARMVEAASHPPQPYTSVFQALQAAVGSNGTQTAAPAILSLLT
jgi:hypothetical protein